MKASPRWEANRTMLRGIREVNDGFIHTVSALAGPVTMLQFERDVKLYNLYEAGCMLNACAETIQNALMDQLELERSSRSPEDALAKLHWTRFDALPKAGTIIEPQKRPPAVIKWIIRKEMIADAISDLTDRTDGKLSRIEVIVKRTIMHFETQEVLLRTIRQRPMETVERTPIEFRPALMGKIMDELEIPDPSDPYETRKRIFPKGHDKLTETERVFNIDHAGNAWTWNCGWYRVGEDGHRLDAKPPLGHATFKRVIRLATPEELGQTEFRYTRPQGMWRRGTGPVAHREFGNGYMELTDGVHAVVKFADGFKREVVLANLEPIAVRSTSRRGKDSKKSERPARVNKRFDALQKQLDDILNG